MNNKRLGNNFEKEACAILANNGFWVHFITPDARGAQPFDIIAVKDQKAYAIECKTLTFQRRYFSIDRLEDNQKLAFSRWMACGNGEPIILVKQNNDIVSIKYVDLINLEGKVDIYEKKNNNRKLVVNGFNLYGDICDIISKLG